jgi:hypothetical protein
MDSERQPPSSQSTTSSQAERQAQSEVAAPSVPAKPKADNSSEGDSNSRDRGHHEDDEYWQRVQEDRRRREEKEKEAANIAKKKAELKDLELQVAEATSYSEQVTRNYEELKEKAGRLNSEWSTRILFLESQRQVLNASRSFAAREGTLDAATLIQSFNDLNSSIGDFSFEVLRGLDEEADKHPLAKEDYGRIHEILTNSNVKRFVRRIADRELKASDVVDPIVTGIIVEDLMSTVFEPFAPGLDKGRSDVLKRIYKKMQASEPQERSARWRSISYTHAVSKRDPQFLHQAADQSVAKVADALSALSGGKETKLPEDYHLLARSIFEAAVKVQNRAKTEYVSFDYEVYDIPTKDPYNKIMMDVSQAGIENPSEVWITIGLGMKAKRRIPGEGSELMVERSIPVKPMVICNNWDHNA